MGKSFFRFRHFTVNQERAGMKVSTDSVLLSCLTDLGNPRTILDIGTGTGLLALLSAEKYPEAAVTGAEIEEGAYLDAVDNFRESPYGGRLTAVHADVRELRDALFDAIIVNPPYFAGNAQELRSEARRTARQDATLTNRDLRETAERLLWEGGIIAICLPPLRVPAFLRATEGALSPLREISLIPRDGKEEYLRIITLRRRPEDGSAASGTDGACEKSVFTVRNRDGSYTEEYLAATDGIFLTEEQKSELRRELGKC